MSEKSDKIQAILDAVTGALVRGKQGGSPPPSRDHWLYPFWEMGNAEREEQEALAQRCRELQEDRQRTADELVAFVHGEHSAVCAERDTLRGLLAECAEYLNINNLTSIGHGSILHRKMIDAAMEATR